MTGAQPFWAKGRNTYF